MYYVVKMLLKPIIVSNAIVASIKLRELLGPMRLKIWNSSKYEFQRIGHFSGVFENHAEVRVKKVITGSIQ